MKIIALEGLDKSGKFTQVELLKQKLESDGYKVAKSEFHRYDTPTGQLIMKWLKKEWDVSQETIDLIMAADKQAQQDWFYELEDQEYDFLILDRYTLSQIAYGIAGGLDGRWLSRLHQYMKMPDLDIVIDIPAEISVSRKGKHNNGENDKYESDLVLLQKVRDYYRTVSAYYSAPIKKIVNGERTVKEIHNEIYYTVCEQLF